MSEVRKSIVQTIIFGSIGAIILFFLWQSLASSYAEECALKGISEADCSLFDRLISDFKSANFGWLAVMCIAYLLSCAFRALRWMMLLRPMGYNPRFDNSFYTVMIGYFANLGLPRMGEFIRAGLFSKYEDVPYEKVLGTIVVGRIIDVLCLLSLLLIGFGLHSDTMLQYFEENLNLDITKLVILGAIGLLGLGVAIYTYRRLSNTNNTSNWFVKVKKIVDGFVEGLSSLKSVQNMPLFILYSVGIWFLYVGMHWIGFLSFGPTAHLSFSESLLCFDFAALGMVFPSPGGMGTYHAMLIESLLILDVSEISAFSIAMITFFTINIFCNILFGLISLVVLPMVNR